MARVAPASESFWAIPQAILRLLARPKTTATLPFRSIMCAGFSPVVSVGKDSSVRSPGAKSTQWRRYTPPLHFSCKVFKIGHLDLDLSAKVLNLKERESQSVQDKRVDD